MFEDNKVEGSKDKGEDSRNYREVKKEISGGLPDFKYEVIDGRKILSIDPQGIGLWFDGRFLERTQLGFKSTEAKQIIENSLYNEIVVSTKYELQQLIVEKATSMDEIQHYRTALTILMLIDGKLNKIAEMKVQDIRGMTNDAGDEFETDVERMTD